MSIKRIDGVQAGCVGSQVTTFLTLASGMPFILSASSLDKPHFATNTRLRFGFEVLQWAALVLLPLFLVCGFALASYEIYYEYSRTSGKAKQFQKLLASLRLTGAHRTPADITNIYRAIIESDFLQPYSYSQLVPICRTCELRELKPRETLFSEGDVGHHFYVLIKGTVDVYVAEKAPPHTMTCINSHHHRGSFGERALLQVTNAPLTLCTHRRTFQAALLSYFLTYFLFEGIRHTKRICHH